ncbi:PTPRU phosphatase, partial [Grallaria varia]|nr:PTPRU phosphatase [Grallaria varia]
MALQLLALRFLLALVSLLTAQGQDEVDPKVQGMSQETERCQRPHWDSRFQLAPDQVYYKKNEEVMLSCPEGFQPSFTHVKCSSEVLSIFQGKPVHSEVWLGRNTKGAWMRIRSSMECIEILQVDPGTFEISSNSIKLNWTCRFPDACQGMRAMCRPAVPSSPPCEAEEVMGEEMSQGQEGTFTCSQLQAFTDYSVTIFLPPSTTLFSWLFRTEEAVPDKPEELWLDPISGSLRWKALPSCKGDILGYQLNITARSAQDGGFLEMERLQVNGSITEHRLPEHGPGSRYVVSIRGVTAAGAGAASLWQFQSNSSVSQHPLDITCHTVHDISPSQGTAILSLRPITSDGVREHQLLVTMTHNGSVLESTCLGQPQPFRASQQPFNTSQQPFNTSQQPSTYLAAVLNLTTPMDFVLGDGTQGQGYHNAALRPGWNYTALLRLVHHSPQSEKFTCVCYSFSVVAGQAAGTWRGTVIGLVVLLALLLMIAGILWLVLSRKRKYFPNKVKEDN